MRVTTMTLATIVLGFLAAACAGQASSGSRSGGTAHLSLDGVTHELTSVTMVISPGEEAWFRIEGLPVDNPHEDCVPGLASGIGLYGNLPAAVREANDLAGKRLRIQFSGDGDDANFCFPGMGGLAGAEEAWITIDSVSEDRVAFSMTGTFKIYDEQGEGPVKTASAAGTAILRRDS